MRAARGSKLRRIPANLALLVAAVAVVFGALEVGLRWFGPRAGDWYAAGPERARFWQEHVHLNSHRFRDREFSAVPAPAATRILALGDSFTFGDGIERIEDTWPRVLERELRGAGAYEVLNLGVPGSNTAYQRGTVLERGYELSPDGIVLGFTLNDPEPPGANRDIVPKRLYRPLLPLGRMDRAFTQHSYAYAWLRNKKNQLLESFRLKETYADYLHSLYEDPETWHAFVGEVRGMMDETRERGLSVTVAVFPMFYDMQGYAFEKEHGMAAEVFREAGADVIDLLQVYEGIPVERLRVSAADAHPNEHAHRLAGEAIARHLVSQPRVADQPPSM